MSFIKRLWPDDDQHSRHHHGREKRGGNADRQRDGEPLDRSGSEYIQEQGGKQCRQVGVDDG